MENEINNIQTPNIFKRTGKETAYNQWWIQKQKERQDESLTMQGVSFFVARDVFSPSTETTDSVDLLLRHFPDVKGKRVLDIGTGCGVLAMKAAIEGAKEIIGTEFQTSALENAKKNIAMANLGNVVQIINNEHFENIPGIFDVIIMNIIFAERPTDTNQIKDIGKQSLSLHARLIQALPKMLSPNGKTLLGFGSIGDIDSLQQILNNKSLNVEYNSEEKFGVNWYAIELKQN